MDKKYKRNSKKVRLSDNLKEKGSLQSEKIGVTLYLQRNESCILNAKVHFIMRYEKGRKYGESQRRSCKNGHGPV